MKVDLIIKNGWVFRTYRQCFEKLDIAISGERFYDISPEISYEAETVVDGTGKYIIPGLIDIHMHIESSMTYPKEFSRIVLPCGVTTVVADPHEIANVFGLGGIKAFMDQKTDLDIFYGIPSCVPATSPELETSGGQIREDQVAELLDDKRVICLGEVMNFKDLTSSEDTLIKRIIRLCRNHQRTVRMEGHCPSLSGEDCSRFIFEGVDADHTQQTPDSVLEKTDKGMFLELQTKSLTEEVVSVVDRHQLYENIALVTDDTMPDHLVANGQLNHIITLAVAAGMPVEKAIYCATLTPARRMHLDDRGMIAPGKLADLVILPALTDFVPDQVYKNGRLYTADRKTAAKLFPPHFYQSVHCSAAVAQDFELHGMEDGVALVNVMQIQAFGTMAKLVTREVPVKNGILLWQQEGLCLAAVFERHKGSGTISYGLIENGLKNPGAVATTWSHDSHNLLVVGNSVNDMVLAQNMVLDMQGGYVVSSGGSIQASARLDVGGILSSAPVEELAEEISNVRAAIEDLGYCNNNVIMSISTLTLLVSPQVKLSDKGLFLVKTQEKLPLIQSYRKGK